MTVRSRVPVSLARAVAQRAGRWAQPVLFVTVLAGVAVLTGLVNAGTVLLGVGLGVVALLLMGAVA